MNYKALYRKWRPRSFDDVLSQPHITDTLKNQIRNSKTAHAYLFTGSRGTGKTTCARIFAKAVNCTGNRDGNPCLECDVCRDADDSALSDIIEIDAASNSRVDDIRSLRDAAIYTPERCRYKVYIIDEVHMLSTAAFNALLKIMEEPPEFVKFILATTELHKVPETIVSRCQRFDFHRIKTADITERLMYIASEEDIPLEENAAMLIARLSDGGMRDALSLLDQCAACSDRIDCEAVSAVAGVAGRDSLFDIMDAAAQKDMAKALGVADKLYSLSKDMQKLCTELTEQFRNLMLLKVCPENRDLLSCMPDEIQRLTGISAQFSLNGIMSRLDILQECAEKMSHSANRRVEFEMGLIKLCSGQVTQNTIDNSQIYDKIKQDGNSHAKKHPQQENAPEIRREPEKAPEAAPNSDVDMSKLRASDFHPLAEWPEILDVLRTNCPSVSGALKDSRAFVFKNIMLIDSKNKFFLTIFKVKSNAEELSKAVVSVMGKPFVIRVKCSAASDEEKKADDLVKKALNSGIETAVE
ncbi:MAG: DNA polymerase III subunit gamma/tau [Porcipelethomonas sp.]